MNSFYDADRFVSDVNIKGNRTPYAPEWFINSSLKVEAIRVLELNLPQIMLEINLVMS
ncbi:hypothetical protein [Algoriphagus boritolerans]|uniref:hypothetical protein n=1 Tax=Algoriphagus boritolerans TaxID=308111 RepID=UPI002FCE0193